jgi:hypothetical protein
VAPDQDALPVAADELADLPSLVGRGRGRDRVDALTADPLLDPVLAQQRRQLGAHETAVVAGQRACW